jgi:hypothetical protein
VNAEPQFKTELESQNHVGKANCFDENFAIFVFHQGAIDFPVNDTNDRLFLVTVGNKNAVALEHSRASCFAAREHKRSLRQIELHIARPFSLGGVVKLPLVVHSEVPRVMFIWRFFDLGIFI